MKLPVQKKTSSCFTRFWQQIVLKVEEANTKNIEIFQMSQYLKQTTWELIC